MRFWEISKFVNRESSRVLSTETDRERKAAKPGNRRLLRLGVIAVAVAVALVAWLATKGSDDSSSDSVPSEAPPRIVTTAELSEAAASLGQPIYWAGPVAGKVLELRELGEAGVQVLYQPEGTKAGEGSDKSLTVGSYPLPDPTAAFEGFAERADSVTRQTGDGRELAFSNQSPTSVYFVSPDNSLQIEVYDPSPARAMSLALSDRVQPVG